MLRDGNISAVVHGYLPFIAPDGARFQGVSLGRTVNQGFFDEWKPLSSPGSRGKEEKRIML